MNEGDHGNDRLIGFCDVALAVLMTWQAIDTLRPVTVIATGLVLGVRTAAALPRKSRG